MKSRQIYKCGDCGAVFEALKDCECSECDLACCGKPLELLQEKTEDEGKEKHVPVIEKTDKGVKISVGSVPHPMEEEHYIEWIELIADGVAHRRFLKPGDAPEAEFCICMDEGKMEARELCNIHGLWKA